MPCTRPQISPKWFPAEELTPELKWTEQDDGKYANATLKDSAVHKPVSTALLRNITERFEAMGGPKGQPQTKFKVKRVEVIRNANLTARFEAAIMSTEQRIEAHPGVFCKPFHDDGVKQMLKERLQRHWLPDSVGLNHAKVLITWHGCSMLAMRSICSHGTADLRTTDGGFFGAGICELGLGLGLGSDVGLGSKVGFLH